MTNSIPNAILALTRSADGPSAVGQWPALQNQLLLLIERSKQAAQLALAAANASSGLMLRV